MNNYGECQRQNTLTNMNRKRVSRLLKMKQELFKQKKKLLLENLKRIHNQILKNSE